MSRETSIRVRRAVGGDQDSLGWLVAHFDPFVIAQVRLRLGATAQGPDEIRDVVNEVWLVTLQRLRDLQPRKDRLTPVLLDFVATTSFNICNNLIRRAIAERRLEGPPRRPADSRSVTPTIARIAARQAGAATEASFREISASISTALDSLDPDKVELLVLRLVEQRSNAEIASALGIPANTVAVRYRRALEKLRAALPSGTFDDLLALRRS